MASQRRGMIVKNTNDRPVELRLASRTVVVRPGKEEAVTPEEVRDPVLRSHLQIRAISIVRPTTEPEEQELVERLRREAEEASENE